MSYSQSYDDAPVYRVSYTIPISKVCGSPTIIGLSAPVISPDGKLIIESEVMRDVGTVQAWSQREALRLASERFDFPAAATSIRVSSYTETETPLVEPLDPAKRRRPVKRARG